MRGIGVLALCASLAACGTYKTKTSLSVEVGSDNLPAYGSTTLHVVQQVYGGSAYDVTGSAKITVSSSDAITLSGSTLTANGYGGSITITATYGGQTGGAVVTAQAAPAVACIGDNLTAGTGAATAAKAYPAELQALLQRNVLNYGIAGQTSTQIAMRSGGVQTLLTTAAGAIEPAGSATAISAINGVALAGTETVEEPDYRLLSTAADTTTRSSHGELGGFPGTLTRSATPSGTAEESASETYTYTQDAGGVVETASAQTLFVPDPIVGSDQIAVIWAGRNNLADTSRVLSDIAAMVAQVNSTHYLVLSVLNAQGEPKGSTAYDNMQTINQGLAAAYGAHYVDVRSTLVAAYNPEKSADVEDYEEDIPPNSLRSDAVDLKGDGYEIVAKQVAAALAQFD